jgi:hypothetical protein
MGRSGEKAVVVLKTVNSGTEEELILYARQHLANYKFSKSVDFMTELPKSGPGKILKRVVVINVIQLQWQFCLFNHKISFILIIFLNSQIIDKIINFMHIIV